MKKINFSKKLKKLKSKNTKDTSNWRVSRILSEFADNFQDQKVYVRDIKDALADRSFALLMLVFCLPNLIPHVIPGTSTISSIPLIFITIQLAIGMKSPWFPAWLLNRSIKLKTLKSILRLILPYLKKIESFLKPRFPKLTTQKWERSIAIMCLILAILSLLPIPLGSLLPAITIILFSLSILEKDGLFVIFGIITSLISISIISLSISALIKIIESFIHGMSVGF